MFIWHANYFRENENSESIWDVDERQQKKTRRRSKEQLEIKFPK